MSETRELPSFENTKQDDQRSGSPFPNKAELERIRQKGRNRLLKLAQPKSPKIEWWTNVGPYVMWGTQDMLSPVHKAAKNAEASQRVQDLSTPKRDFQSPDKKFHCSLFLYSCGRPSVICQVPPAAKKTFSTQRVEQLAKAKGLNEDYKEHANQFLYSCGRVSPVWGVQDGAKSCLERARTNMLAKPKGTHQDFQLNRDVQTTIPSPALHTKPTERVESLASPRQRPPGPFREPTWEVTPAAMNGSATNRMVELARTKGVPEGYLPAREVQSKVTRAAKRAVPSDRVEELSKPIVRASMGLVQFNPDAFIVQASALKGVPSRRVEELAAPIQRG